jgi:hypothetical protein
MVPLAILPNYAFVHALIILGTGRGIPVRKTGIEESKGSNICGDHEKQRECEQNAKEESHSPKKFFHKAEPFHPFLVVE